MSFFIHAFRARFKSAVTPSFLAAFFLLSAAVLALGVIFNQGNGLAIRVGVLQTDASVRVVDRFKYYGREDCEIVPYTDEEQMKQDVAAHKLECAYVFAEETIIAYRSPMTVTDKVLDMLVAAAYLETMAGNLGADVLEKLITDDGMAADIQARAEAYLRDGALMEMIEVTPSAPDGGEAAAPYRRLFHGLTGLFGWLMGLLVMMGLAAGSRKAVMHRIRAVGRSAMPYTLAGFAVAFVVVFTFVCLTVTICFFVYPGVTVSWGREIMMAISLAAAVAGVSSLLAACFRTDMFPAVISFVMIFAALLGGTAFDIREVLASVSFLRFFCLNFYYSEGIAAGLFPWIQVLSLCGAGLATGFASAMLFTLRE